VEVVRYYDDFLFFENLRPQFSDSFFTHSLKARVAESLNILNYLKFLPKDVKS
jgi:hypothetical protein